MLAVKCEKKADGSFALCILIITEYDHDVLNVGSIQTHFCEVGR